MRLLMSIFGLVVGVIVNGVKALIFFIKTVWLFTVRYVKLSNDFTRAPKEESGWEQVQSVLFRYPFRFFLWAFTPIVMCIVPVGLFAMVVGVLIAIDQATIPNFDVDKRFVKIATEVGSVRPELRDIGIMLMSAAYLQMEQELDSFLGWTVNDVAGLQFWDNRVSRQLGVRHASIELLEALSIAITKFGSMDEENPLLVSARQDGFVFSPDSWILPTSEGQYRGGIKKIKQYQESLRANMENATINITNKDIETILLVIDSRVLEVPHGRLNARNFDVSFLELDDRVFFAQGAAIVARDALVVIKYAFADKIIAAGAMDNMDKAIASIEGAIQFHPWLITRGYGDSMYADHRAKMSRYYTDARQRVRDVAEAINR